MSPGPDGFNFHFIKSKWDIMKSDVCQVVKRFQIVRIIPNGCNASFITLVPKKQNRLGCDDYLWLVAYTR